MAQSCSLPFGGIPEIERGAEAKPPPVALEDPRAKLGEYQEKLDGLIDALAKGQIAPEAFKIVKRGYESKIEEIKRKIASMGSG
jgi:hypothetical protein